jgi:hypothetical protein
MRRRNHQIILRLDDRELALLKERMAAENMNCSKLLRHLITDVARKDYDAEKMKKLLMHISKMGSNINQIARIANSMQHVDDSMLTTASFQIGETWRLVKEMATAWQ